MERGDIIMSTKLFRVRNIHTHKLLPNLFEDKVTAKVCRDEMNGGLSPSLDKTWLKDKGWRVTYGPDHWRYEGGTSC